MNAATLNRFVKSGALIASVAIVAAIAGLINVQASPSSNMPVVELPRVVVTAKRATIVELPRVVVTGHRVTDTDPSTDSNVAERAAAKSAVRG
jgi:hypothetical protein